MNRYIATLCGVDNRSWWMPIAELERGRESYARQRVERRLRVAVRRRSGRSAGAGGPRAAGPVGLHARPRRRLRGRPGARASTPTWTPARRRAPCAAPSGSATTCCSGARRPARGGWFARAQRLLERDGRDCVERGYLLIPVWLEQMARGDFEAGYATAAEAAAIGERFGDADLVWLARDEQGRALVKQGRVEEGLRLVDEALVVATAGELSPIVTGIVYCNTIAFCQTSTSCATRGVDRGADAVVRAASPRWWPTTGSAWCTAPRSCSSRARGRPRSRRRGAPPSGSRRAR